MFQIATIVFRESLEISLLLGIIYATTRHVTNSRIYILYGIIGGVVGASIFAFFTQTLSSAFFGLGDEIFDAIVILITAAIISWTIIWMRGYSGRIYRNMDELSIKINNQSASPIMLALVVAAIILREGTEIILLIYSISTTQNLDPQNYLLGFGLGAFFGILAGTSIYLGLIKFAGKYIFKISSFLLLFIAAGLAAQAAGIFTSVGTITVLTDQVWDSSWLITDFSIAGKVLHNIIGYTAKPNGMQLIFYTATILINLLAQIKQKNIIKAENA